MLNLVSIFIRGMKMKWWEKVCETVNEGDVLYTPGRGLDGGNKRKPFTIISKQYSNIVIQSGNFPILIERHCFDVIEETFSENPERSLRVASSHSNEPFKNSADEIIRNRTGSNLARGNYICSILEHCGLVKYSMAINKKVIGLP